MTALVVIWAVAMSVVAGYVIGHAGHGLLTAIRRHRTSHHDEPPFFGGHDK